MHEVEKFEGHIIGRSRKGAIDGISVVVVNTIVLVVKCVVKDAATEGGAGEHAFYKRPEFYITVVKGSGDWAA